MNMLAGLTASMPRFLPWCKLGPQQPAPQRPRPSWRRLLDAELPSTEETKEEAGGQAGAGAAELGASSCGWFDSSHELRHGLVVREHASDDCLATELPLAQWLELHLHGWRGTASAMSA